MAKINLKELTIRDLDDYAQAVRYVCAKYERDIMNYRDINGNMSQEEMKTLNQAYQKYNGVYQIILKEIERRLNDVI